MIPKIKKSILKFLKTENGRMNKNTLLASGIFSLLLARQLNGLTIETLPEKVYTGCSCDPGNCKEKIKGTYDITHNIEGNIATASDHLNGHCSGHASDCYHHVSKHTNTEWKTVSGVVDHQNDIALTKSANKIQVSHTHDLTQKNQNIKFSKNCGHWAGL